MEDSWGDGWNGASVEIDGVEYGTGFTTGASAEETFDLCGDFACTTYAVTPGQYPSEVTWTFSCEGQTPFSGTGDGEGTFGACSIVNGCTDPEAANYDPNATDDDGSCIMGECAECVLTMNDSWGDGWNGASMVINGEVYGLTAG
jgi:hypothetical protein